MLLRLLVPSFLLPVIVIVAGCAGSEDGGNGDSQEADVTGASAVCPTTVFPSGRKITHASFTGDPTLDATFKRDLDAACKNIGLDLTCKSEGQGVSEDSPDLEMACENFCAQKKRVTRPSALFQATGDADKAAFLLYSAIGFATLNNSLWSGDREMLGKGETTIAALTSALNRLPNHDGPVFRGDFLNLGGPAGPPESRLESAKARFDGFSEGGVATMRGYWSTTVFEASKFMLGPLVYRIHSKTGKDISEFSAVSSEGEVLFRPCTTFRVLRKEVVEQPKPIKIDGQDVAPEFPRQFVVHLEEL